MHNFVTNFCAVNLSNALLDSSSIIIPESNLTGTWKDKKKNVYKHLFTKITSLANFLKSLNKTSIPIKTRDDIKGKQGIILFNRIFEGVTGHICLYDGSETHPDDSAFKGSINDIDDYFKNSSTIEFFSAEELGKST